MYKLNYFNFKQIDNGYLITTDAGKYAFIDEKTFNNLLKKSELKKDIEDELIEKGFIYNCSDEIFSNSYSKEVRKMKEYLFIPTSLHIFVVSKNCNFKCIYCQAGNLDEKNDYKMTKEIAKKAVDIAMQSPSEIMTFEFQGGEPLTNFDVIKYIVEYTESINSDKIIEFSLVSNLTLMSEEMLEFLINHNVNICTSIDGNKKLHNTNRPFPKNDSYECTVKRIKDIQKMNTKVNAIETTSKYSFNHYREIIDEYVKLGLDSISLRPLTQLGKADSNWEKIGYEADEFLSFYDKSLKYIIEKNKEGYFLSESLASIFLKKILMNQPVNYMELRSPCGGAIGQLAYYYDGNIYSCDEARMLSEMGDNSFKLGNVFKDSYEDLMNSDVTKSLAVASCLECIPTCNSCVYSPYCGTCPVITYAQDNNLFAQNPNEYRCKIYKGILDILFEYIRKGDNIEIFKKWIE
ncbi:MAG: His-Xaa-Ser system radical SAM maturase HxsB [Clostridia bacterium]|nr:His-Xaa-Ser system radical SAM maturase HxsB [Bacilli bacterium]MBR3511469.1 His-Xaa-Ser system radical SAM maturase HxsB [Clostridia bacterium]